MAGAANNEPLSNLDLSQMGGSTGFYKRRLSSNVRISKK